MRWRVSNIKISLEQREEDIAKLAAKKLGLPSSSVIATNIVRKSIDARNKKNIAFVYTVDVELAAKVCPRSNLRGVSPAPADEIIQLTKVKENFPGGRPVVIGAGPAGLFAALYLAKCGVKPLVLERGQDVAARTAAIEEFWQTGALNTESNVAFGEGGAGTFSDGKLTTRINDFRVKTVLAWMFEAGAPEEIVYLAKPHVGTDRLRQVVQNLRRMVQNLGGEVRFSSKVTDILTEKSRITGVIVNNSTEIPCQAIILATGHSARDIYRLLYKKKLDLAAKAFAIGARIEHPQKLIDQAQYGDFAAHPKLGAADYHLTCQSEDTGRAAYSFCMCPGGQVVAAASEQGGIVTNGMSNFARDSGVANSALVAAVTPDDFSPGALGGIAFQRKWEEAAYKISDKTFYAPAQTVEDFLAGRASGASAQDMASYRPGTTGADLHDCLPAFVTSTLAEALISFNGKIKGFAGQDAVLTGVETRTSAPVRILRNDQKEAVDVEGLFPAGEGAGYAGGIISAAVDGLKVAEALRVKFLL